MKRAHFLSVAEKGASHHPFRQFMAKTPREGGGKEGESDLYSERRTYSAAAPDRAEYLSH
jgi:hypothetical protein